MIYVNRLPSKPAVGMSVAAVEGEQEGMDGGGTRTRFAIAALESGRQRALLTFMMSSRADFLKLVRKVLESVTFADAAVPCIAGAGMNGLKRISFTWTYRPTGGHRTPSRSSTETPTGSRSGSLSASRSSRRALSISPKRSRDAFTSSRGRLTCRTNRTRA